MSLSEGCTYLSFLSFIDDFNAQSQLRTTAPEFIKRKTLAGSLIIILKQCLEKSLKPWPFTYPLLSVHFMRPRRKTKYFPQVIIPVVFSSCSFDQFIKILVNCLSCASACFWRRLFYKSWFFKNDLLFRVEVLCERVHSFLWKQEN